MSSAFVSLAALLRPVAPESPSSGEPELAPLPVPPDLAAEYTETLSAVRRFRAAVADALDVAVAQLLEMVANDVLARELLLGDPDLASIVAKARERFVSENILAVRVHPRDRNALGELHLDAVADASLKPGDVMIELRSGTIDLCLATRLDVALAACGG